MASDPIGTVRLERHDDGHSTWVRINDPVTDGAEWTCISSTAPGNVGCAMGASLAGWAEVIGAVPGTPAADLAGRAVVDAVASAHLSGVDVPADHVETLEAVARGEVTADDAVQAVVDSELRDRIAAELATHSYSGSGSCDCGTWAADQLWDVTWVDQWLMHVTDSVVDFRVAPMLAAKDEALAKMRLAYEGAMFKVHAWEQNSTPAGNALVDLVEARRLLRQRNVAYGRASATIGVLRGALARSQAARTWLTRDLTATSAERAAWANKAELLRAELDAVKAKTRTALHFALSCCNQYTGECDDGGRSVADLMRQEGIEQPDTGATEQPPKTLADKFVDAAVAEVNRINSTTAREPRVWRKGDPMPEDVWKVRDVHGDVWTRNVIDEWTTPETKPCGWPYMAKKWAPLTEVIEDGGPARPRAWTGGARQPDGVDRVQAQNGDTFGRAAMDGRWYSAAGQGGPSFSWQELLAEHGIVFEVLTRGGGS